MEDSTGVVGCGWNEQRKVGERHRGVHGTDTDNKEKPGHPICSRYVQKPLYVLGLFRQSIFKGFVHSNDQKHIFSHLLLVVYSHADCVFCPGFEIPLL